MTVRNVSTAAGLASALAASVGGDTILLAPGNYGDVNIAGRSFTSFVTLKSADPANRAIVSRLNIDDSAFIRADDLHVSNPGNGGSASTIVSIQDSNHVQFMNSEVNGLVDNDYSGHYAVFTKNTDNVTISGNDIHDAWYGGVFYTSTNFVLSENFVDKTGSDGFKFIGVHDFLIENNEHGGNFFPPAGTHVDFIQFQGTSSSDGVIRGNVFLAENFAYSQGIFLKGAIYDNIVIEENIIYTAMANGIKVEEGSGVIVRNNTVLHLTEPYNMATYIIVPPGGVSENNIISAINGGLVGSNISLQTTDPNGAYYYDDFFANADAGLGITLEDLRPVEGSLAETYGAYDRLMELLGEAPAPSPDPTPPPPSPTPDPDPSPNPDPPPEPGMIYQSGPHTFTGSLADAVIALHDPAYELAAGSLEIKFTAAALSTRKGIFSKDATGFGLGGHISILAEQSKLVVRLQNGTGTFNADVPGAIAIGVERHFVLTWGPGGMKVWLDGLLAASNAYTGGTIGNTEPIVIGANQWTSAAGTSVPIIDPFTGTIDKVAIYDYALTETEIGILAGIIVPQTPEELIAALQAMIATLEATIAAQDATIALLTADLATANAMIATQAATIAVLNGKISAAQAALA